MGEGGLGVTVVELKIENNETKGKPLYVYGQTCKSIVSLLWNIFGDWGYLFSCFCEVKSVNRGRMILP